jgi:hypothetical protein
MAPESEGGGRIFMHRSGIRGTDLLSSAHGNCGPTFAVPNWTDARGWTDPSFGPTSEAGKGSAT